MIFALDKLSHAYLSCSDNDKNGAKQMRLMNVAATDGFDKVLTSDDQGLVQRTITDLIAHAANRYACESGAKMFLNIIERSK